MFVQIGLTGCKYWLVYDRIDVSEGLDNNEADGSCECFICHYWYFLRINFIFQTKVCDRIHDVTQKSMGFNDFATAAVKRNHYRNNFWLMIKRKAVDRMEKADLSEKGRLL